MISQFMSLSPTNSVLIAQSLLGILCIPLSLSASLSTTTTKKINFLKKILKNVNKFKHIGNVKHIVDRSYNESHIHTQTVLTLSIPGPSYFIYNALLHFTLILLWSIPQISNHFILKYFNMSDELLKPSSSRILWFYHSVAHENWKVHQYSESELYSPFTQPLLDKSRELVLEQCLTV